MSDPDHGGRDPTGHQQEGVIDGLEPRQQPASLVSALHAWGPGLGDRSVDSLQNIVMRLLRRFGLVSALWTSLLALFPSDDAERPWLLGAAVGATWVWAVSSQFVVSQRSWFVGWVMAAVGLELLPAVVGTSNWSLTGGAAILVLFAAAITSRLRIVVSTLVLLVAASTARPFIDSEWSTTGQLGSILVFVFVAFALLWLVRWTERALDERDRLQQRVSAAERERAVAVTRAEAAARLHDSVLQTLAATSQADSLPQAQDLARKAATELRLWVRGGPGQRSSLRGLLERAAHQAADGRELSINITGGGGEPSDAQAIAALAVAEAVRNAATHTDGAIRVYGEESTDGLRVWIADRGDGFQLEDIPDDRAGVRESIIGRMERIGGTATLRQTPEGGSEWELHVP